MNFPNLLNKTDNNQSPTIEISCEGATTIDITQLNDLQGNLKSLSDDNYAKLRRSIEDFGFSFPVFMWTDKEGKKWIVDAHQRIKTLRRMQEEGYVIPPLPADNIFAKDKTEAKKKLLVLNSQYGQISETGLEEFINEADTKITIEEIEPYLEFPDISFAPDGAIDSGKEEKASEDKTPKYQITITCASSEEQQTTIEKLQNLGIIFKATMA